MQGYHAVNTNISVPIMHAYETSLPQQMNWITNTEVGHSKFQFYQDRGPVWKPAKADVASSLNINISISQLRLLKCQNTRLTAPLKHVVN